MNRALHYLTFVMIEVILIVYFNQHLNWGLF